MSGAELDPGACWVRHVKRASSSDAGARSVLGVYFAPQPLDGVNGRQGWQSAQCELRLSDDGSFTARFPNAAGEDGRLHRDRFAILSDPLYRPGEEWLEFYREPGDVLFVGTPVKARLDRGELVLEGLDGNVLVASSRASEADVWVGAAPSDVLRYYSGALALRHASDLRGWTGVSDPRTAGWTLNGPPTPAGAGDGIAIANGAAVTQSVVIPLPALSTRDFILEVRWRHAVSAAADARLRATYAGITMAPQHNASSAAAGVLIGANAPLKPARYAVQGTVVHRLITRGEWAYFYVDGELVGLHRWSQGALGNLTLDTVQATAALLSVRVITSEALLGVDGGDLHLPGTPPPGGLRARYYNEQAAKLTVGDALWRHATLNPLAEPYNERLEVPNFAAATPPAWQPAGPPGGEAFSVRWTGAIYLDLAASDRNLSFALGGETFGRGRVWIAGRLVLDYSSVAGSPAIADSMLRGLLGSVAGWFPICVEYSHLTGAGGITLYDQAGAYNSATRVAVPSSRLSPIGTVDLEARHQSYREVLGDVAGSFGYQWTLEPRTLESGRFPGQIRPRVRLGRDTALVIDELEAMEAVTEVDAGDVADSLIVDASGLAELEDGAQLSHEAFLPGADHLIYSQGYESLAEISEAPLLRSRAESLLALRSSPNEVVGVRPQGRRDLVDRFPLPASPELARMLWTPGDGVRLALADLAVIDRTPRQLTTITWPLVPDGAAPPVVGFRQRPRGLRQALERTRRAALAPQRSYQGNYTTIVSPVARAVATGALDSAARLVLPTSLEDVRELELVVLFKADVAAVTINVNGASTGLTFTRPGPYDITRWLARAAPTDSRLYASLTGGDGSAEFVLRALVRI